MGFGICFSECLCAGVLVTTQSFPPPFLPLNGRFKGTEFSIRSIHFSGIGGVRPSPCSPLRSGRRKPQLCVSSAAAADLALTQNASSLPAGATSEDAVYMRRAIELARQATGKTSPNPIVGCVIVKDGQVVGEGFHPKAGEPHAEVFALREAGSKAKGATAYVTLEPCNHFGRTPPCSQALVKAKVKRVVVGTVDPNPLVGGKGVKTLRDAGIEVVVGVEEESCRRNVEAFMFRIVNQRPFASLRYTMSLDGRLLAAPVTTTQGSHYSRMLQECDAVVVTDAALYGNPKLSLLSAEPDCKQPLRVVVAFSLLDLDPASAVFDTALGPSLVVTTESALVEDMQRSSAQKPGPTAEMWLRDKGAEFLVVDKDSMTPSTILDLCYQRGACSVLWDCQAPPGSGMEGFLAQWAVEEEAVEKVVVSVPFLMAGREAGTPFKAEGLFSSIAKGLPLKSVTAYTNEQEIVLEGYL